MSLKNALPYTIRSMPKRWPGSSVAGVPSSTTSDPPAPIETIWSGMYAGWNGVMVSIEPLMPVMRAGSPSALCGLR